MATMISDLMSRDPKVLAKGSTIAEAAKLMRADDVGVIPVNDGDDLVGVVTDRDIAIRGVADGKSPDQTVSDVMTGQVLYCFEDDDPAAVSRNMAEQGVRRLPVVNRDKRLVGMVSLADIARGADTGRAGDTLAEIAEQPGQM